MFYSLKSKSQENYNYEKRRRGFSNPVYSLNSAIMKSKKTSIKPVQGSDNFNITHFQQPGQKTFISQPIEQRSSLAKNRSGVDIFNISGKRDLIANHRDETSIKIGKRYQPYKSGTISFEKKKRPRSIGSIVTSLFKGFFGVFPDKKESTGKFVLKKNVLLQKDITQISSSVNTYILDNSVILSNEAQSNSSQEQNSELEIDAVKDIVINIDHSQSNISEQFVKFSITSIQQTAANVVSQFFTEMKSSIDNLTLQNFTDQDISNVNNSIVSSVFNVLKDRETDQENSNNKTTEITLTDKNSTISQRFTALETKINQEFTTGLTTQFTTSQLINSQIKAASESSVLINIEFIQKMETIQSIVQSINITSIIMAACDDSSVFKVDSSLKSSEVQNIKRSKDINEKNERITDITDSFGSTIRSVVSSAVSIPIILAGGAMISIGAIAYIVFGGSSNSHSKQEYFNNDISVVKKGLATTITTNKGTQNAGFNSN